MNAESSDFGDYHQASQVIQDENDYYERGDIDHQVNVSSLDYGRYQRHQDGAGQGDRNEPSSQGTYPASICSTSTFRICPVSIKNKSSMSSW